MSTEESEFKFNISLSVLNHLGRNLYRNIITVIGEAISNSWDADATNVYIKINREQRSLFIMDDGVGMTADDFQKKFLKVGYSKRNGNDGKTPKGRVFIGRKGIGKLALLSCAKRIHIGSKIEGGVVINGLIDNSELDKAIVDDESFYNLQKSDLNMDSVLKDCTKGTAIFFEDVNDEITNTIEYIKKAIALYFRFSLIDEEFKIFVNDEHIGVSHLKEITDATQFLWNINNFEDPYLESLISAPSFKEQIAKTSSLGIKGFIVTVDKPSSLKVRGTNEKVTLDLFVNGRLRERDILKRIPTTRIVESYTYGQLHFDCLDTGVSEEAFVSSREGVITDNPTFVVFKDEVEIIFRQILGEWDTLRRKYKMDGDTDNVSITKRVRKAQELYNRVIVDTFQSEEVNPFTRGSEASRWVDELGADAEFNIPSYVECFIAENLVRKYMEHTRIPLDNRGTDGGAVGRASRWRGRETSNKTDAGITFDIRKNNDDWYYSDMTDLSYSIATIAEKSNKTGVVNSAIIYKPLRDAVAHTSLLTDNAKGYLNNEFNIIKARLLQKLISYQNNNRNNNP